MAKQTVLRPLFEVGKWSVTLETNTSKIFVEKIVDGKKTKVPCFVRHIYLILTNTFGTEVRFHPYQHKANNMVVRFSDSRTKELKGRGPKGGALTIEEMVDTLRPWIGAKALDAVQEALDALHGDVKATEPEEELVAA